MPIKTVAVAVTSASEAEWLISAALDLANSFGAHLTVVRPVEPVVPFSGSMTYDPVIIPELLDWQLDETQAIRDVFDRATSGSGLAVEFRGQEAGGVSADAFLLEAVRAADIVLIGRRQHPDGAPGAARLHEHLIRQSGRPVLVIPRSQRLDGPAGHLLIGWSATREATRAAHDAFALAAPGARIDLLTIGSHGDSGLSIDSRQDLATALDRLGFRAELVDRQADAGHAGEVLLKTAFERGADLVVTGAFGHSRAYDFVIGAVTSHLLEKAEMPVLLSK